MHATARPSAAIAIAVAAYPRIIHIQAATVAFGPLLLRYSIYPSWSRANTHFSWLSRSRATIIDHRPALRSYTVHRDARPLPATGSPRMTWIWINQPHQPCDWIAAPTHGRHSTFTSDIAPPPPFAHSYYHRPRPRRMVALGFGVPRRLRVALLSARPPARRRAACALGAAASGLLPSAPGLRGRQPTRACRHLRSDLIYCELVRAFAEQETLPLAPIPIPTLLRLLRATRAEPLAGLLHALEPILHARSRRCRRQRQRLLAAVSHTAPGIR